MILTVPQEFKPQSADSDLKHQVKLKNYLGTGRTISSVVWSSYPSGATFDNQDDTVDTSTTAEVYISGLTAGQEYLIKGLVTVSDGQVDEFRIPLRCLDTDERV